MRTMSGVTSNLYTKGRERSINALKGSEVHRAWHNSAIDVRETLLFPAGGSGARKVWRLLDRPHS